MRYRGGRELSSVAVFLGLLHLGLLLVLLLHRRWRREAARREEVRRLMRLAAEEDRRAEMEAAMAYTVEFSEFKKPTRTTVATLTKTATVATPTKTATVVTPPTSATVVTPATSATVVSPPPQRQVCALCFRPASGRCSRCKAVRYCSGKCQIVHWREGHKDDCRPPSANDGHTSESIASDLKRVEAELFGLRPDKLELEREARAEAVDNSHERPDTESAASPNTFSEDSLSPHRHNVEASKTKKSGDNHRVTSVPKCSLSSLATGTNYASASAESHVLQDARLEESSSAVSSGGLRAAVDFVDDNPTKRSTAKLASGGSREKSNFDYNKNKVSRSRTEAGECLVQSDAEVSASTNHTTTENPRRTGESLIIEHNKIKTQSPVAETSFGTPAKIRNTGECLVSGQSDAEVSASTNHTSTENPRRTGESLVIEHNKIKTQSPVAETSFGTPAKVTNTSSALSSSKSTSWSEHRGTESKPIQKPDSFATMMINDSQLLKGKAALSNGGGLPPKIDSARPIMSLDSSGFAPSGLAVSVKRVVKQFTSPKLSRTYPSEMMLFPYDLFIQLYNSDKVELCPCGLTNCGNSCYANSVLQCLAFTRPLTAYLLEGLHSKICRKEEWCFTCELEKLLMNAKQGKTPLSPIGILSYFDSAGINLGRGREEDAHEFLRFAVDAMQSVCLKEAGAKPGSLLAEETTLIQQTFGGYLQSKIKCGRCKSRSEKSERMMDLTVEIHGDINSLEEALSCFTSTEILDGENKYECDRCKSYERAKKKLTILEAPNILTITLKRFQSGSFGKLNKAVGFPEYLDLAPYMSGTDDKSPIYRLYAVIVHIDVMDTSSSGHYVSYVKDIQGNWYHADDSKVKPVELDEVLSQGAYMLLYARCSPRAPRTVRKAMAHELMRTKKRSKETKGRPNSIFSHHGPSVAYGRSQHYSRQAADDSASFQISDRSSERHHHMVNDSFSDSSSLFSCSDEGSRSTDSTMESTITEELRGFISGEFLGLDSPQRVFEESDAYTDSPLSSIHSSEAVFSGRLPNYRNHDPSITISSSHEVDEPEAERIGYMKPRDSRGAPSEGNDGPFSMDTDQSKQYRAVVDNLGTTHTDWINPGETNSNMLLRRPSRVRTSQTFY